MQLPDSFLQQMKKQLGEQLPAYLESLNSNAPVSLHFNPSKCDTSKNKNADGVKWYNHGVYLKERPVFTLDPLFHAGQYYVQEASSMFLAEVVRQTVDVSKPLRVLDLAAAPGGKSTLLASILHPESFILCNEVIKNRFKTLQYNLIKWGTPNTHISNHDSREFEKLAGFFDLIILDAPCSGEGLFRKDHAAVDHWSADHIEFCSLRQQRILKNIVELIKPGGALIYSTCTYNEKENEKNGRWLEAEFGFKHIAINLEEDWNITPRKFGYQFFPHLLKGEGFYISCFRKQDGKIYPQRLEKARFKNKGNNKISTLNAKEKNQIARWVELPDALFFFKDKNESIRAILSSHLEDHHTVQNSLYRYLPGTLLGTFKRDDFIPSAELALSLLVSKGLPSINLDKNQALRFLKKEVPELDTIPDGWVLVDYKGLHLGWVKGIRHRINNYYPKAWRIKMNV